MFNDFLFIYLENSNIRPHWKFSQRFCWRLESSGTWHFVTVRAVSVLSFDILPQPRILERSTVTLSENSIRYKTFFHILLQLLFQTFWVPISFKLSSTSARKLIDTQVFIKVKVTVVRYETKTARVSKLQQNSPKFDFIRINSAALQLQYAERWTNGHMTTLTGTFL